MYFYSPRRGHASFFKYGNMVFPFHLSSVCNVYTAATHFCVLGVTDHIYLFTVSRIWPINKSQNTFILYYHVKLLSLYSGHIVVF